MPTYKTLVALVLVASNVSPALSAPVWQVREQSLNRRAASAAVAEEVGAAGKKAWGPAFKKYGKEFLIGTGATMAFAYAFEKLNGSGSSKASSTPSTPSVASDGSNISPNTANTGNDSGSQAYPTNPNYSTSTSPNDSTSSGPTTTDPNDSTSTGPTATDPTSASTDPTYSTSTYSTTQTQQRAVEHDLPADSIFEARSASDNYNQNRQAASLDLSGRADLVEAIRLFSRVLDELD